MDSFGLPDMTSQPLKVAQLSNLIKQVLEGTFPALRVEGEISNFRPSSTGHWYFTLKDDDAVISAVMFRNRLGLVGFRPADGCRVVVSGSLSVYEKRGSYQIVCETMEEAGLGRILAELEERKRRLALEGLFDQERKLPLPLLARRIAVVTSPTGAALKDILQVTRRRARGLDVVVVPVPVQGLDAGPRIARGIELADRLGLGDVIIVARGGGSLEDLLPFSDEVVVRAVAACATPLISAVGHEIDTSLCDLAADVRAPTPSAAAELVAASREELLRRVLDCGHGLASSHLNRLAQARANMRPFSPERLEDSWLQLIHPSMQRLDDAKEDLLEGMELYVHSRRERLEARTRLLESLSPWDILKRGYAVVRNAEGYVDSAAKAGGEVEIRWADGSRQASIKEQR